MKVTVSILNHEYRLSCTEESRNELEKSVEEIRSLCELIYTKNPKASIDKILVTAAVNIASQAISQRRQMESLLEQVETLKAKVGLIE